MQDLNSKLRTVSEGQPGGRDATLKLKSGSVTEDPLGKPKGKGKASEYTGVIDQESALAKAARDG